MDKNTRIQIGIVAIFTALGGVIIGCVQLNPPTDGGLELVSWMGAFITFVSTAGSCGLARRQTGVGIVPLLLMLVGQAGVLVTIVRLQSPSHSFLSVGLAIVIIFVSWFEKHSSKRSAQTP